MIFPQVLKLVDHAPGDDSKDVIMAFPEEVVLHDGTQDPLGDTENIIQVDLDLFDISQGSFVTINDKTMNFDSVSGIWYITIDAGIIAALPDRHKFIGKCTKANAEVKDMRTFRVSEFTVDNGSFEQMIARLPYEIVTGTPTEMRWYENTADFGGAGPVLFHAELYKDNTGTTPAASVSEVTHRGPIIEGP